MCRKMLTILAGVTWLVLLTSPLKAEPVIDWPEAVNCSAQTEVLITALQTGQPSRPNHELIELHNQGAHPVDLATCHIKLKDSSGNPRPDKDTGTPLSGVLAPGGFLVVANIGLLDSLPPAGDNLPPMAFSWQTNQLLVPGGTIELIDQQLSVVADLVYGEVVGADLTAKAPATGGLIKRCTLPDFSFQTLSHEQDFIEFAPLAGPGLLLDEYLYQLGPACPEAEAPSSACEGVIISELLPNPAGADTGKEFIELHNPTEDFVPLNGCGLQVNQGSIFWFEDIEMTPGQFLALKDSTTGLILPNSGGGEVYLLSSDGSELDRVAYPGGLSADVAWAWFGDDIWQATYSPTPGKANISQATKPCPEGQTRHDETNRCRNITSGSEPKPCAPGQERNPATNRCRSTAGSASSLVPCRADQERNPATNRCRSIVSSQGLKPCAPDQERNPATNRCRKIANSSSLKPCAPGQERNPATNRCRKKVSVASTNSVDVQDIEALEGTPTQWAVAGALILLVGAYGVWEWRHDISNKINSLRQKITSSGR